MLKKAGTRAASPPAIAGSFRVSANTRTQVSQILIRVLTDLRKQLGPRRRWLTATRPPRRPQSRAPARQPGYWSTASTCEVER